MSDELRDLEWEWSQPDQDTRLASMAEAADEYVVHMGRHNPDREWILSQYDTWHRNPAYRGPAGPHPEE